jgi:2-methylcitrate dehydratase PrpD
MRTGSTTGVGGAHREERSASLVQRTDGRSITVETTDPIGSLEKPLTSVQLEAKFRDCTRNAVRPLAHARVDELLAAVGGLETSSDARELMTAVAR